MMKKNRFISACLILCLLAASGCGSAETAGEEVVVLKDPINSENGWITETVMRRNLYLASVYVASVYPEVEEYAYETRQTFESYEAMLGDTVEAGDELLRGNTESLDTQIENYEERLAKLTEKYTEYKEKADEEIAAAEWSVGYYQEILDNLEEEMPEQYIVGEGGSTVLNQEYDDWEGKWHKGVGDYDKNGLVLEMALEGLRQETEIYQLDYAFYTEQLNELKAQREAATLTSQINGEVVGIGIYEPEQELTAETVVVAVGDLNKKVLKCPHIARRNIIYYAKEVYAVIDGKRYEIIYEDNGDTTGTTFRFADENVDVEVGDYAVVVLENNSREQVIAVKKEAVYVDASGHYVYVVEDGATVQKPVKIGVSDGIYTEIVSGLEEGEALLVSDKADVVNTHVLELGTFEKTFSRSGQLCYPISFYVSNNIEYGTVFFQEYLVDQYQYVEEGEPIISIRVEGDMVELERMETELERAKQRLADLIAQTTEENAEANAASIEKQQEEIAEQEEIVTKMREDYTATAICAEKSGVIMYMNEYDTETIVRKNVKMLLMADANYGYLMLEGADTLKYGDMLTINYTNASKQTATSEARVVTLGKPGVSEVLDDGIKYARISEEVIDDLLEVLRSQGGNYNLSRIKTSGVIDSIENVLLVPKKAVTEKDGVTYVNVVQEDGTAIPISFLAGGSDGNYYWVIEGLTEGMTICWE